MKKTLELILKNRWYDMIASGEKREEYREWKPYWLQRLGKCIDGIWILKAPDIIRFRRGYTNLTMEFRVQCMSYGTGNPQWGAPEEPVIIFKLGKRID